jgi:cytochrome c oxidase subunit 2
MRRSVGLLALLGMALANGEHYISILTPYTSYNREDTHLLIIVLSLAALVFLSVVGPLLYVILRFRKRPGQQGEPPQFEGNNRLEVIWTAIPLAIVFTLFILTAQSVFRLETPPPGALRINVTGRQFFWNFDYPTLGIRTSNELIVPADRPVALHITSADVIHGFWVPSLVGMEDATPGVITHIFFTAQKPGDYYGECEVLCGAGHADMRFRVIVLPPAQFDAFVHQAQTFKPHPTGLAAEGQTLFLENCSACHMVQGTSAQGRIGPDLSYVGYRSMLGAYTFPNTMTYLEAWIHDPQSLKPGVLMPAFPQLTHQQLKAIATYLETLKLPALADTAQLPKF